MLLALLVKVYNEYIPMSTSACEFAQINTCTQTSIVNKYSFMHILVSIAPLYRYVDLKYMIYGIYMIDLGH
jgi:hypothetical protein